MRWSILTVNLAGTGVDQLWFRPPRCLQHRTPSVICGGPSRVGRPEPCRPSRVVLALGSYASYACLPQGLTIAR
ncbi:hypothetical protein BDW42DRAFT_36696 [Aspergillus taichungensis]|uniref:Uncharacterized protein n=1 Tax=Aspergillus taichungensis TaxID=482145 RepID=A0A2J5I419_9EURO|nr:hypothetical protein BDW42DRAFT_36696 [Aspergillus taichungensis]